MDVQGLANSGEKAAAIPSSMNPVRYEANRHQGIALGKNGMSNTALSSDETEVPCMEVLFLSVARRLAVRRNAVSWQFPNFCARARTGGVAWQTNDFHGCVPAHPKQFRRTKIGLRTRRLFPRSLKASRRLTAPDRNDHRTLTNF